jgi:hypothetical protein
MFSNVMRAHSLLVLNLGIVTEAKSHCGLSKMSTSYGLQILQLRLSMAVMIVF